MAKRKKKGKIKLSQKASVRKKGEGKDSLKKIQGRPPADNTATLKIKVRKK